MLYAVFALLVAPSPRAMSSIFMALSAAAATVILSLISPVFSVLASMLLSVKYSILIEMWATRMIRPRAPSDPSRASSNRPLSMRAVSARSPPMYQMRRLLPNVVGLWRSRPLCRHFGFYCPPHYLRILLIQGIGGVFLVVEFGCDADKSTQQRRPAPLCASIIHSAAQTESRGGLPSGYL